MVKHYWFVVLVLLFSCSDNDNNADIEPEIDVNSVVLEELYKNEINTALSAFKSRASEFKKHANNTNWPIYDVDLYLLRDLWLKSKLSWERLEVYDIGPVRSNYIKWQIDYWPTNTSLLETKVDDVNTYQSPIDGLSASVRGLPAIEYLLFKESALNELNEDSLRWVYTQLLISDISVQEGLFKGAWDGYANSFLSNTEIGINGSVNVLFNNMLNELELMVNNEIGTPLGIKGTNVIAPNLLEGYYSESTRDVIQATMEEVFDVYNNVVFSLVTDQSLNYRVQEQFKLVFETLDLNKDVEEKLVLGETADFNLAHDEIQVLLKVLKIDVASHLGVALTIGDSDGD